MFPKMGKETLPQVEKVQKVPYRINQEETRRDTYYSNWPKLNTKKDIKSNKRTAAHNIRGNPPKAGRWYFSRNSASWKRGARRSSDEREKPSTQNTLPSKPLTQNWQRNQKPHSPAKAKRIQWHQTSFPTNAKGNFLDGKIKGHTRYKKIIKWKNSLVKGNIKER